MRAKRIVGVPAGGAGFLRGHAVGVGSVFLSVGLVAALAVGVLAKKGTPSTEFALSSASAWFPSPNVGSVALIDGTTVTRVAEVPVSAKGRRIETVQAGSDAYVVDLSSGQLRRVDGASAQAGSPIRLGSASDSHMAVRSNGHVTWTVEAGGTVAQQRDPRTLAPLGPATPFPGHATTAPALGADGTLWLIDGGLLRALSGGMVRTSVQLAGVSRSELVMASGRPVVLDLLGHRAIQINPHSGHPSHVARYDSADPAALVTGSSSGAPQVLAVSPTAGSLLVCDLGANGCGQIPLGEPSSRDRYGQPVASGRYVYVPDYQAGTVIMVDVGPRVVVARPLVDSPGARFGLLAYHGFVWFDDTAADKAGVVTLQGATAVSTAGGDQTGTKVTADRGGQSVTQTSPGGATANTAVTIPARGGTPQGRPAGTGSTATGTGGGTTTTTTTTPTTTTLTAAFTWTPLQPVARQSVAFKDTSTGNPTGWQWTFDHGTPQPDTRTEQNPTYTWANPGTYTVTLVVTRSGSGSAPIQKTIRVTSGAMQLTITPTTLGPGTINEQYGAILRANGGTGQYNWSVTNPPPWLQAKVNSDGTYDLSGTPNAPGATAPFTVRVTDGTNTPRQQTYTITILRATIPVGSGPIAVGVDPTTHTIYVANESSGSVSVIDGATRTVTATIPVGNQPEGVGVDPATHTAYVANWSSNSVSVINGATVTATIPVGNGPDGVGVDSVAHTAYVANSGSNSVSVINGAAVTATIPVGNNPWGVGVDPSTHTAYVANHGSNSVSVINGAAVTATIPVGNNPWGVGVDPSTHTAYVANSGSNSVSVINGAAVTAAIPVGSSPTGVGVDSVTHTIYVANTGGLSSVSVINGAAVTATIPGGADPFGVGVDPTAHTAYVANNGTNTVSVIDSATRTLTA